MNSLEVHEIGNKLSIITASASLTSSAITHHMYQLWHSRKHVIFAPLDHDRNIIINWWLIINQTKVECTVHLDLCEEENQFPEDFFL